jgi:hypothetical protein
MLNKPNTWLKLEETHLNRSKKHHDGLREPSKDVNERLVVNKLALRPLHQVVTSFLPRKVSNKYIPTRKSACSTVVGTSNSIF